MKHINSLNLAKLLMEKPSITPDDCGALDCLQEALESLGFKCERKIFSEEGTADVDNLYARLGSEAPNICFAGHTDVVPPGNLKDWTSPPFEPEVRDGMLYGRGAVDMKASIACFVGAVSDYLQVNGRPKGSISFLITGDEEDVAINGTRKMLTYLEEKGEKLDACIVGEPTNPNELGDMIKIGRRGSVNFVLTVHGVQGHVAYPQLAFNPIPHAVNVLSEISAHNLDDGTEFFDPSNLEITSIDVGNKADNVIPASVRIMFNIRFNDKHQSKTLIKWIEGVCDSITETTAAKYELKHRVSGESFITQPGPLSDIVSEAVKEVTDKTPELSTTGGTSDARFIKDYCPVVECGLINQTAHKVNECAKVADIENLTKIYSKVLEKFFAQK